MNPHDAPTAAQLIESVREWIERDVIAATEGRLQFHARVAINALAMVERELLLDDELRQRHADRLAQLQVVDEADLAARLRAGELDNRLDEVREAVRATVVDKLRVANPKYLTAADTLE